MESTLLTLFLLPPYKTAANLLNSLIRCIAFFVNKHKIVDNSQVIHNLSITHKPHRGDWSAVRSLLIQCALLNDELFAFSNYHLFCIFQIFNQT